MICCKNSIHNILYSMLGVYHLDYYMLCKDFVKHNRNTVSEPASLYQISLMCTDQSISPCSTYTKIPSSTLVTRTVKTFSIGTQVKNIFNKNTGHRRTDHTNPPIPIVHNTK